MKVRRYQVCSVLALCACLILLLLLQVEIAASSSVDTSEGEVGVNTEATSAKEEQEKDLELELDEPGVAVLFPWFTVAIGAVVFFFTTRLADGVPYTTVMFLIGTIIGIGNAKLDKNSHNHNFFHESVSDYWRQIDAEVLLLCFLPGLIFKDAWSLDANLFQKAFLQMINFAFPMVLGGMFLTAVVAKFILPYDDWSFDFCLMFGSILSATDPVAVAALLETVGAPPRLKVHISGEALMNDGSAIVFYTIFSQRYLLELGVPALGSDVAWGDGFSRFFRMSCGGVAIGIAFGMATLLFLHFLKRRLNHEENVVEVSLTVAAAYLCYFVADFVWGTSGVIATLTMGLLLNEYARPSINDLKFMKGVWSIVEHILNTILFTLGGLVWGNVIANSDANSHARFDSKDWGYLFLLYILLHLIRFVLFALFYPATSRLGLKTNMAEQAFQVFGGLRGAVGIALAIAIDNTVMEATEQVGLDDKFVEQTSKLFGHVGGMAFLTLCINAPLAGPLLKKLGLADSTSFRQNLLGVVGSRLRATAIDKMVALLSKPWFSNLDYTIVQKHVSVLKDVYLHEVVASAKRYENANHHRPWYSVPRLNVVVPHLKVDPLQSQMKPGQENELLNDLTKPRDGRRIRQNTHHRLFQESAAGTDSYRPKPRRVRQSSHAGFVSSTDIGQHRARSHRVRTLTQLGNLFGVQHPPVEQNTDPYTLEESRRLFLEVLRAEYERLIDNGNLARREDLNYVLRTSVDFCADRVNKGGKLTDWEFIKKFRGSGISWKNFSNTRLLRLFLEGRRKKSEDAAEVVTVKELSVRFEVNLAIAFLEAHTRARRVYSEEFAEVQGDLSAAEKQVLTESEDECKVAELFLSSLPKEKVKVYVSHIFCIILLNRLVKHVESLAEKSFLKQTEAEEFLEHIQEELFETETCPVQYYRDKRRNTLRGKSPSIIDEENAAAVAPVQTNEREDNNTATQQDLVDKKDACIPSDAMMMEADRSPAQIGESTEMNSIA